MKIKVLVVCLLIVILVTGCVSDSKDIKNEETIIKEEKSEIDNIEDNSSSLGNIFIHRSLTSEQEELLISFGILDYNYAMYEYENIGYARTPIFIDVYEKGELIKSEKIYDCKMANKQGKGTIVIRVGGQGELFFSYKINTACWVTTTTESELGLLNDNGMSGTECFNRKAKSIIPGEEIALYSKQITDNLDGVVNLNLDDYSQDDLKEVDYCYIVKVKFETEDSLKLNEKDFPKEIEIKPAEYTLDMNMGVGPLDMVYASDEKVILWGYMGLFVYDLESENLSHTLELEYIDSYYVQGSVHTEINASDDGNTVYIRTYYENMDRMYQFDLNHNTLTQIQPTDVNNRFDSFADINELGLYRDGNDYLTGLEVVDFGDDQYGYMKFYGWELSGVRYTTNDKEYVIFK